MLKVFASARLPKPDRAYQSLHCNGNSFYIFLSWELRGLILAPISTFICLWAIYIFPRSVHIFPPAEKADPSWVYNSPTDTWMWKLGLRPRYSFTGNICFKFSAFCLRSVTEIIKAWKRLSKPRRDCQSLQEITRAWKRLAEPRRDYQSLKEITRAWKRLSEPARD